MSSHTQSHDEPHVDSPVTYLKVYGALLVLTVFTVLVSTTFNLGAISHSLSLGVAMLIATMKGTLVVLFFMHVLHEEKLVPLVLVVALFFLVLFFAMTMADVATRGVGDYVAGSQSFRELNNLTVIDELPEHGAGHGAHGEEAGHGAEAGHGDEAAHGDEDAADGENGEEGAHGEEGAAANSDEEGAAEDEAPTADPAD